jgi:hypothetical protein
LTDDLNFQVFGHPGFASVQAGARLSLSDQPCHRAAVDDDPMEAMEHWIAR